MKSLTELERELNYALQKCQATKEKMKTAVNDPTLFTQLAQEANDAWLEFRHKEVDFNNHLVRKQMGDLYGCY